MFKPPRLARTLLLLAMVLLLGYGLVRIVSRLLFRQGAETIEYNDDRPLALPKKRIAEIEFLFSLKLPPSTQFIGVYEKSWQGRLVCVKAVLAVGEWERFLEESNLADQEWSDHLRGPAFIERKESMPDWWNPCSSRSFKFLRSKKQMQTAGNDGKKRVYEKGTVDLLVSQDDKKRYTLFAAYLEA